MRSLPIYGFGIILVFMGAGLFILSLRRKAKPGVAPMKKSEQREEAALRAESRKLRIGAGILAGLGVVLIFLS